MTKTNFKDFKLSEELLKAISLLNFASPTKVQEQAIPSILDNEDIIVKSQTGERVIIVTRCINAFKLRVSETLTKYISSLLRVIKV